jgi:hypothetical protein
MNRRERFAFAPGHHLRHRLVASAKTCFIEHADPKRVDPFCQLRTYSVGSLNINDIETIVFGNTTNSMTIPNGSGAITVVGVVSVTAAIRGTAGNDTLAGTTGKDILDGLGGNDTEQGNGGDDACVFRKGYGNLTINTSRPRTTTRSVLCRSIHRSRRVMSLSRGVGLASQTSSCRFRRRATK